jgi:hypothetical protein
LDTLKAGRPPLIRAIDPASLDTLTMRGRGLERSSGSSPWISRQAPNKFTSSASATGDRSPFPAVPHKSGGVEALFTIASTRPQRSWIHVVSRPMLTELSTSICAGTTRSPSGSSSLAASSARRGSREPSSTRYPSPCS